MIHLLVLDETIVYTSFNKPENNKNAINSCLDGKFYWINIRPGLTHLLDVSKRLNIGIVIYSSASMKYINNLIDAIQIRNRIMKSFDKNK